MLCDNCKKREANVRYTENINGVRRELNLCEECSLRLGIADKMNFNIDMDFPSFNIQNLFGGIFEDLANLTEPQFMPLIEQVKDIRCKNCGMSFEDITENGRLGCPECYETFETRLDPILKRIQGANRHTGRIGKINQNKNTDKKQNNTENTKTENTKIAKLEEELKQAVKEERYEDAAKIRDEINKNKEK